MFTPTTIIKVRQCAALVFSCALVAGLSGCGGGGSSGTPSPQNPPASSSSSVSSSSSSSSSSIPASVTYTVMVDIPAASQTEAPAEEDAHKAKLFSAAEIPALSNKTSSPQDLTADQFAVTCVDLSGRVEEVVKVTDASKNEDGSWDLTVPLEPRLDCLVAVQLSQPEALGVDEYITQGDALYAPMSANTLDVDVLSTAAFNSLISELGGVGSFEDAGVDAKDTQNLTAINHVMTNIAILLTEQGVPSGSDLTEILAQIELLVTPLITEEVVNIKNPASITALDLVRDGGGMHIFNSDNDGVTYRAVVGSTVTDQRYSGNAFVPDTGGYQDRSFMLGSDGWVHRSGEATVDLANSEDGTVVLVDSAADSEQTIYKVTQGFTLSGRKIAEVLKANPNTTALAAVVDPNAVFPEGAHGYRLQVSNPQLYVVFFEPGDVNGVCFTISDMLASHANGNCNQQELRLDANIFQRPAVTYESLFSPDVAVNSPGSRTLPVGSVDTENEVYHLDVQLLNDGSHTARFYARSWEGTSYLRLIDTGTWREFTLPNGNPALYFDYPQSVLDVAYIWGRQTYQAYTVQDGFVRHLGVVPPAVQKQNLLVLDSVASESVINAMSSQKTAAACFNPSLYEAGAKSFEIHRYPNTDSSFDLSHEVQMKGPAVFNGQTVLHSTDITRSVSWPDDTPDVHTLYFTIDSNALHFNDLGGEVTGSFEMASFYHPGRLLRFDLKEGESFLQSYTNSNIYGQEWEEPEFATTFTGIKRVTVPAGTYDACHFIQGSTEVWYMVDTGIKIKEIWSESSGWELVSYSGNGFNF